MRTFWITIVIALLFVPGPGAQEGPAESNRTNMQKIAFLVGEWQGGGGISMGPTRSSFRSHESVQSRLDGQVLVIEGVHEGVDGAAVGKVVHHAIAIVSWDQEAGAYRFNSHMVNGRSGDFTGRYEDGAFVWSMTNPQAGQIRYGIRLTDDGRWHEVGERSADGQRWSQFFEMTLRRAP